MKPSKRCRVGRKRQREEQTKSGKTKEDQVIVTPHTLRLLKVLQEGTVAHASVVAASHLSHVAARSSPQVLWDILGRLQAFLVADQEWSRRNAALAIEQVSRHLPSTDQRNFLTGDHQEDTNEPYLWLTVAELKDQISTVLEHGRQLYSSKQSDFDVVGNDDIVDSQNTGHLGQLSSSSSDFVEQRVSLQRRIMAQRMGLAGVASVLGSAVLPSTITREDLLQESAPTPENFDTKESKRKERKRKKSSQKEKAVKDKGEDRNQGIRSLLVFEIRKQSSLAAASHKNPQTLLATELLFRMFDPEWYTRHGALMGINSLLKAWGKEKARTPVLSTFGSWPQDILARCLCILALDRFEDWSSEIATSPVREEAALLLSTIYSMTPESVRFDTINVLWTLTEYQSDWEVRHGGLLGLWTIVTPMERKLDKATALRIMSAACMGLEDSSDEVKMIGAKIVLHLVCTTEDSPWDVDELVGDISSTVWDALKECRDEASCLMDLILLFSKLLTESPSRVLRKCGDGQSSLILSKLLSFLDVESTSVHVAALDAIGVTLKEASRHFHSKDVHSAVQAVFSTFFFSYPWLESDSILGEVKDKRSQSWRKICAKGSDGARMYSNSLALALSGLYFGEWEHLRAPTFDSNSIQDRKLAAQALVDFFDNESSLINRLIQATARLKHIFAVESACLLFEAASSSGVAEPSCQQMLIDLLNKPVLMADQQPTTSLRVEMEALDHVFSSTGSSLSNEVDESDEFGNDKVSEVDIQAAAAKAAAIVSSGCLPGKVTLVVQALMNGLMNERMSVLNETRSEWYSGAVATVILLLFREGKSKTSNKILEKILIMLVSPETPESRMRSESVIKHIIWKSDGTVTLEESVPLFWDKVLPLVSSDPSKIANKALFEALDLLHVIAEALHRGTLLCQNLIQGTSQALVLLSCCSSESTLRTRAADCVEVLSTVHPHETLRCCVPSILRFLKDEDDAIRLGATKLLTKTVNDVDLALCPFVKILLPAIMTMMADREESIAKQSSSIFAILVRLAPLVKESEEFEDEGAKKLTNAVIDHLIHGKALPSLQLPPSVAEELSVAKVNLRHYQEEGIAWMQFLHSLKLNGALCDDMGVGKTLQSLVAVALAHDAKNDQPTPIRSLIVAPSTVVNHWRNEVRKFFPSGQVFRHVVLPTGKTQRRKMWNALDPSVNLVICSYSSLRTDVTLLEKEAWRYCILDEGHLLKNPKTATALAARRLRSSYRLILTGTPVQNRVQECWAAFDWLMPNFLGSDKQFQESFVRPISKSHQPGASAETISLGMEKLKILHQQVLPFILRREKEQVLKELPRKTVTLLPCEMTPRQTALYKHICRSRDIQTSLSGISASMESDQNGDGMPVLGKDILKSILSLRLICTHPFLFSNDQDDSRSSLSGKFEVLRELLVSAGIGEPALTAADNDESLIYNSPLLASNNNKDETANFLDGDIEDEELLKPSHSPAKPKKCLIFAQFRQSLDVLEKVLLATHLPSMRYLRLDGGVPVEKRQEVVDLFHRDESIQVLLLTTRVGGLGLNLTAASIVIFLESDFNPHADIQAMDRAHRIGQSNTVNVYRLVSVGSLEEKIMQVQRQKLDMSQAIVNSENSTMFSMGTDRLLDIFTFKSEQDLEAHAQSSEAKRNKAIDIDPENVEDIYAEYFEKQFDTPIT